MVKAGNMKLDIEEIIVQVLILLKPGSSFKFLFALQELKCLLM